MENQNEDENEELNEEEEEENVIIPLWAEQAMHRHQMEAVSHDIRYSNYHLRHNPIPKRTEQRMIQRVRQYEPIEMAYRSFPDAFQRGTLQGDAYKSVIRTAKQKDKEEKRKARKTVKKELKKHELSDKAMFQGFGGPGRKPPRPPPPAPPGYRSGLSYSQNRFL